MNISQRFSELEQLETKEERQAVFKAALKKVSTRPRFWLYVILVAMIAGAGVSAISLLIGRRFPVPSWLRGGVIGGLIGGFLATGWQFVFRGAIQREIRLEMVARGVPVCLGCGYDLRGQVEHRCPECGLVFS